MTDDKALEEACSQCLCGQGLGTLGPMQDSAAITASLAALVREREEKAFQDGLRLVAVEVRMARAEQREKDRQRMIAMFCCGVDADTNSANRLAVERALPPLKLEP